MSEVPYTRLAPGDRAPDFELPAAHGDGVVRLAEHYGRGAVLLVMLRGLYCPFCRMHLARLGQVVEPLRSLGIGLLGVVVASPERARRYFGYRLARFPVAAATDRAVHRAYGLLAVPRDAELREETERQAKGVLRELGIQHHPGEATAVFLTSGGFEMTPEDEAEFARARQAVGYFLIGRDGVIRWTRDDIHMLPLPSPPELIALIESAPNS
jgi:peroxiredoxin